MKVKVRVKILLLSLAALVMTSGWAAVAHASRMSENPKGDPPFGVAIQRDAQGEKLIGVVFAEFFGHYLKWNPDTGSFDDYGNAQVIVRLRKGAQFATFYAEALDVNYTTPAQAQPALMAAVEAEVLAYFFQGEPGLKITIKSMTEYGQVDDLCTPLTPQFYDCQPGSAYYGNTVAIADVILAVK